MKNSRLLCYGLLLVVFLINNAVAQDSWSQGADMLQTRGAHTVGIANGKIYAVGGHSGGITVRTTEEYNPGTNTWTTKTDMSTSRKDFSGCGLNDKIYAIGGWRYVNLTFDKIEEYNPATDTWTTKTDMPTTRWGHATCAVNDKIYVIGGATGWPIDLIYETIEVYDPITNTWETKASIPTPRWMLSCSVVDGKIYAIGGHDDQGAVRTVEVYDPETNTWSTKSQMPTARWGLASATINEKIYAIGGGNIYPPTIALRAVEEYNPITDSWTTKTQMPAGRILFAACSLNGKIYLPGGGGILANESYAELYIYNPGETGIEDEINALNFKLHQNYPNPFKLSTTIKYSLASSEFVSLKVFSLVDGREMEVLVNSVQDAGNHQIIWETKEFPSGIYFYRLQSGGFSQTKKFILQK